jgi:hypothetical protein
MRSSFFTSFILASVLSTSAFAMGMKPPAQNPSTPSTPSTPPSTPTNGGGWLRPDQMPVDLSDYDYLDQKNVIPNRALERATKFYELNKSRIGNKRFMTIIDLSKHASKARMYLVNMSTGSVATYWVSAGRGSDPDGDGYATKFSNAGGSNMSSLGFYLTGGLYDGQNGSSMYLHGLESSNSNAYARSIVMHGADYVYAGHAGRSLGCPAIERRYTSDVYSKTKSGSLLYIHYNQ